MNYFAIFGIQQKLDIDIEDVESRYLALQLHHNNAHYADQLAKLDHVTNLNHAYQALLDPLRRSEHLLSLYGITTLDAYRHRTDAAFLQTMIDKIELIDTTNDSAMLQTLLTDSNAEYQEIFTSMQQANSVMTDTEIPQSDTMLVIIDGVMHLRYLNTIISSIKQKLRILQ